MTDCCEVREEKNKNAVAGLNILNGIFDGAGGTVKRCLRTGQLPSSVLAFVPGLPRQCFAKHMKPSPGLQLCTTKAPSFGCADIRNIE